MYLEVIAFIVPFTSVTQDQSTGRNWHQDTFIPPSVTQ